MPGFLHQLDADSILLAYLAGELPAEDHAEVERMLAGSERLREQLDVLQDAYAMTGQALAAADGRERVALSAATASRRVGLAVRSWHARRLAQPPAKRASQRWMRLPRWAYPLAGAAALVVAGVWLWGVLLGDGPTGDFAAQPIAIPFRLQSPDDIPTTNLAAVPEPFDLATALGDEQDDTLDEVEDEMYALTNAAAEDATGILLFGDTDER